MRILVRLLVASLLVSAGLEQPCFAESANNIRIGKLVIESNSLPDADRARIIHLFQQKTYCQLEIGERISSALRNLGYFKAVVDEPKFSFPTQGERRRIAHVTVKVEQGAQYRLGEIYIQKATIFPSTQLRNLFSLRRGDLFNVAKFVEGLEDLRKLYQTRGYVNFVATPITSSDESRRTVDLVLDVEEDWKVGTRISDSMRMAVDPESLVVNVRLTQWPESAYWTCLGRPCWVERFR